MNLLRIPEDGRESVLNKLLTRTIVAAATVAVVGATGAVTANAQETQALSSTQHTQLQAMWHKVAVDSNKHDMASLKADTTRLLKTMPVTYASFDKHQKAQRMANELPPVPPVPSPAKALCDLASSLLSTVSGLLTGLGVPAPLPANPCAALPAPPVPPVPAPPVPAPAPVPGA